MTTNDWELERRQQVAGDALRWDAVGIARGVKPPKQQPNFWA